MMDPKLFVVACFMAMYIAVFVLMQSCECAA